MSAGERVVVDWAYAMQRLSGTPALAVNGYWQGAVLWCISCLPAKPHAALQAVAHQPFALLLQPLQQQLRPRAGPAAGAAVAPQVRTHCCLPGVCGKGRH